MTVLEMQTRTQPAVRWTEVCATEHTTITRPSGQALLRTSSPASALASSPLTSSRTIAPGRQLRVLPASAKQVRSCRVSAPSDANVVDDVPTWALLACGVVFGLLLLLAVALLGGPAYA